ncbi:UNVERIFIED_CONTAM: hypothetical protein PYX00_003639 [Menopon gallinae]|uniref:Inhibitor of growth protein n=1 Tax=Menopon gallinae TaxID=328185 RepID=A0AAW2I128_9NEOP
MLNQAAIEAMYSATYIENYLDCVENLPDDLQRHISRVRELDVTYQGLLKEVEQQQESFHKETESTGRKRSFLVRVQQALISAQEVGDEKLQIIQQLQDLIENKARQLDIDYRNLDVGKDQDSQDISKDNNNIHRDSVSLSANNNGISGGERQSKRARRTRNDAGPGNDLAMGMDVPSSQQQSASNITNSSSNQKKTGNTTAGKKKKRKSRQNNQQHQRDDSPPQDDELPIDPDEPTYCLCDQISYGEMIMCDNDLCPYEWFHFSCVSLGVKPKGKWYCPKCRGDKSSVMKPKAQFMKELERYNKEKEQKEGTGS